MGVESFWHGLDEVVCIGLLGSPLNQFPDFFFWSMLVIGAYKAVADILKYSRREYGGLLADEANLLSQPCEVQARDIVTIDF